VLLAWEHNHFPPIIKDLISRYNIPADKVPTVGNWPSDDYDTIWKVQLDGSGNLTVDNGLFEGIDSSQLPKTAPQF
jgi:hypothetical protein